MKKQHVSFDYSKLKGKIAEVCDTRDNLVAKTGISKSAFINKMNGKVDFNQSDISIICNVLNIQYKDIPDYFFKA